MACESSFGLTSWENNEDATEETESNSYMTPKFHFGIFPTRDPKLFLRFYVHCQQSKNVETTQIQEKVHE